ncbi:MAG: type IV pili methyl-accepting chemotaxis transducer N-terminal domain-containing protein [Rhodocyclaceae bacterium]|nr:type IV pili methyl-accepting chemotaxis transducer N-terminal domain-containing protein [Rhodocyclaceae bacterium]MBX3667735.1 type IV pili methyl-accepting chemotaxis transducer N-terminal domain-containing protein [Rhodocyclaceae bacterium]
MFGIDLGKYRTLVVSIFLFLLFDLGVLVLNFVISSQIAHDAEAVNLAGRQRMLSQRTAKAALQIEKQAASDTPDRKLPAELANAAEIFDRTLRAFMQGGETVSGSGSPLALAPLDDAEAQAILQRAAAVWTPYRQAMQAALAPGANADAVAALVQRAEAANLELLGLMNDLTTRMESIAASKAKNLRMVQVGGITLATINFVIILVHFIGHLRRADRDLEHARKQTDDILKTTQEGLFLLDPDYRIGSQHSRALGGMLGSEKPGGASLIDLLRPAVSQKTLDTAREYIDLLLKHDVKERLVASLNPLDRVEINLSSAPGDTSQRYLKFAFNRVTENKRVTHLLVTANDITKRVELERDLKESEERSASQMSMLVELLRVDPAAMQEFLSGAGSALEHMNSLLKDQTEGREAHSTRINGIYRVAHRLKGDAAALGLTSLAANVHGLESLLTELRERATLTGENFLPVTVRVKSLFADLESIQNVVARVAQMRSTVLVEAPRPAVDADAQALAFVQQWRAFAHQIAQRRHKQVELSYGGLDLAELPAVQRETILSVVNQFIRNAIVHGIETPDERRLRGKPVAGRLAVYVMRNEEGGLALSFRDDGQGISVEGIRQAALKSGRLAPERAHTATDRELIGLIFEPGLSTQGSADEDAGRGAGLDAVKEMVVGQGGRIRIGTTRGEYCHFRVALPAPAEQPDVAAAQPANQEIQT